jgi:hypothetical protein
VVIRSLVDRLENLEKQIQQLQQELNTKNKILVAAGMGNNISSLKSDSCLLQDREIREFLDGMEI